MKTIPLILLLAMTAHPAWDAMAVSSEPAPALLERARRLLEEGEIYEAKKQVRDYLDENPGSSEGWDLMAQILDDEISRQLETATTKVVEEYTEQERLDAIKTWLERSEALLDAGNFEEATYAAERVFLLDPENLRASTLVDRIRTEALAEGRGDSLAVRRIYQTEIDVRVQTYLEQAEEWQRSGRRGAAKLAVEKVLLLDPENRKALRLYEEMKKTP